MEQIEEINETEIIAWGKQETIKVWVMNSLQSVALDQIGSILLDATYRLHPDLHDIPMTGPDIDKDSTITNNFKFDRECSLSFNTQDILSEELWRPINFVNLRQTIATILTDNTVVPGSLRLRPQFSGIGIELIISYIRSA